MLLLVLVIAGDYLMETTNPRINVTLDRSEFDLIKQYAQAKRISLSKAMLKLTLEKLEDYEDIFIMFFEITAFMLINLEFKMKAVRMFVYI